MTEPNTDLLQETPDEQLSQRWRQGERVDVAEFLASFPTLQPTEMVAVLLTDQRERWQAGDRIPAENYLRRFPALESDADAVRTLPAADVNAAIKNSAGQRRGREDTGRNNQRLFGVMRFPRGGTIASWS